MNDDVFERKLAALAGRAQPSDPTPAWKAEILARAKREAAGATARRGLPPRWLLLAWSAAWVLIVLMRLTTPEGESSISPGGVEVPASSLVVSTSGQELSALLAFHRELNPQDLIP